jgi:hypothetical protein
MEEHLDSSRLDRRALLAGGASVAAGALFLGTGRAGAASRAASWVAGVVTAAPAGGAVTMTELPLGTRRVVRLAPGAVVRADLAVGETVLVDGVAADRGASISASRVIPVVFGSRSDVVR